MRGLLPGRGRARDHRLGARHPRGLQPDGLPGFQPLPARHSDIPGADAHIPGADAHPCRKDARLPHDAAQLAPQGVDIRKGNSRAPDGPCRAEGRHNKLRRDMVPRKSGGQVPQALHLVPGQQEGADSHLPLRRRRKKPRRPEVHAGEPGSEGPAERRLQRVHVHRQGAGQHRAPVLHGPREG